jgi:CBS domain-containing protein
VSEAWIIKRAIQFSFLRICPRTYMRGGEDHSNAMPSNEFFDATIADLVEPVSTFNSSDTVARAVGILRDSGEHEVIVEDKNGVAVITVGDLLNVDNLASQKLSTLMKRVPRINRKDTISTAAKVMFDYRVRELPVYNDSKLAGKVTSAAIAKLLVASNLSGESIARIATPDPICVDASDTAAKAKQLMIARKIDQLPILKNRKLSGVVTSDYIALKILPDTDRMLKGERRSGRLDMPVSKLSQPRTITNEITDSLKETVERMISAESNYSIIVNGDEVQGIVTYRDFLKLLPPSQVSEQAPVAIVGLPKDPLQSEFAKERFQSSVKLLMKAWPHLTEARAIIKAGETKAPKRKYEVQVFLTSENSHYNYKVVNYDLAKAFEEIEMWIKKLAERRGARRTAKRRSSTRKLSSPEEIS